MPCSRLRWRRTSSLSRRRLPRARRRTRSSTRSSSSGLSRGLKSFLSFGMSSAWRTMRGSSSRVAFNSRWSLLGRCRYTRAKGRRSSMSR
ncbi:hypothetical protein C8T65DRAFT_603199 [Cerioporus squamosus]|nr:hypothetical protein C8T65DRAFT_603199 [Cerioporus squamosus]